MERAKLLAIALVGIAHVSNCCESAVAQPPSRFIRQPKSVKSAELAPAQSPAPADKSLQNAAPLKVSKNELAPPPAPTLEFSADALVSFPSLLAATTSAAPDLQFNAADSFASVPELPPLAVQATTTSPNSSSVSTRNAGVSPSPSSVSTRNAGVSPALSPLQTAMQSSAADELAKKTPVLQWTSRAATDRAPLPADTQSFQRSSLDAIAARTISVSTPAPSHNTTSYPASGLPSAADSAAVVAARKSAEATHELLGKIEQRMEAMESTIARAGEPAQETRARASLVSARIVNDPRFSSAPQPQIAVDRVEPPQGWQAIGQRLTGHIAKCEGLLSRGAFFSAREESETACLLLLRHIDLHDNLYRCESAWQAAHQALSEAEDFLVIQRGATGEDVLKRLIDSHETPVLKGKNLAEMSPLTAAQHYRLFAELELTEAAQGHPWASELLYTVGRTFQSEADATPQRVDALRMKAMAYYSAARATLPTNAIACNQLGYLLLQMDRNAEAREALTAAVSLKNDVAFLGNLAEASRRLGDTQTANWAAQNVVAIREHTPPQQPIPAVVEISPAEFASISPRNIGPKPNSPANTFTSAEYRSAAAPQTAQLR